MDFSGSQDIRCAGVSVRFSESREASDSLSVGRNAQTLSPLETAALNDGAT